MEKQLTKFISAVFHPMLFPTYYLFIIFNMQFSFSQILPETGKWRILILVFISTFLIPGLFSQVFGRQIGKFIRITGNDARRIPLSIALFFYVITYSMLSQLQISPLFTIFILGSISLLAIALIITTFWSISIYMVATGALFGAFLCMALILKSDMLLLLMTLIFVAGFVGYSRLKTSAHQPMQVYSGFLLGAVTMYLHFLYF